MLKKRLRKESAKTTDEEVEPGYVRRETYEESLKELEKLKETLQEQIQDLSTHSMLTKNQELPKT